MDQVAAVGNAVWLDEQACNLDDFRATVERETTPDFVPLADDILSKIPIYNAAKVRSVLSDGRVEWRFLPWARDRRIP